MERILESFRGVASQGRVGSPVLQSVVQGIHRPLEPYRPSPPCTTASSTAFPDSLEDPTRTHRRSGRSHLGLPRLPTVDASSLGGFRPNLGLRCAGRKPGQAPAPYEAGSPESGSQASEEVPCLGP